MKKKPRPTTTTVAGFARLKEVESLSGFGEPVNWIDSAAGRMSPALIDQHQKNKPPAAIQ